MVMKSESKTTQEAQGTKTLGRREFLRTLGAGATVAAASGPLAAPAQADTESNDEKRKSVTARPRR